MSLQLYTEGALAQPDLESRISVPEFPNMFNINPDFFYQNVPPSISSQVDDLFSVFGSVAKYDDELKTPERLNIDYENYMLTVNILNNFKAEGRFNENNQFSLNRKSWSNEEDLAEWKKQNIRVWYDPLYGSSQNFYEEGLVGFIPGDIVTRKGAGAPPFEHWGIYVGELDGEGYTLEIVRDQDDGNQADIRLTSMREFVVNRNYPMYLTSTISSDGSGGFIDNRAYDREISLWTGLKSITVPWIYGIGLHKNKLGIYDQTCQSYVNILIMGKAYTEQIWQVIFNMTNTGMTIYMGQLVTKKMLEKQPNVCIEPCDYNVFAGGGSLTKDCVCISSCGTSIPLVGKISGGKSWCYVDQDCGKKKNRDTYNGYYYDYCDNNNVKYSCPSGKVGKYLLCSNDI